MMIPALSKFSLRLLAVIGLLRLMPVSFARQWIAAASSQTQVSTTSNDLPKQLLIDVSVIHQHDAGTGIQRVVRSVLSQLQEVPVAGYSVHRVVAESKRPYYYAEKSDYVKVKIERGDIFLGLDLVAHLLPKRLSQLLEWKLAGARLHFVVYDILPLTQPTQFTSKRVQHFNGWARLIATMADSLLCISGTVQSDLQAWLSKNFELTPAQLPTQVIPLGSDFFHNIAAATLPMEPNERVQRALNQLQGQRWALMVGTLEPRKCHVKVLDAFEQLWHKNLMVTLVLVGRAGWHTEELQRRITTHAQLNKKLFWLNEVNDAELELIYQLATGVVAASLAEGYGLPLIEAIAHGKPLLVRDLPVFREVADDAAQYFSDDSAIPFSVTLNNWLGKSNPVKQSMRPQYLTTWADATRQILLAIGIPTQNRQALPKGQSL